MPTDDLGLVERLEAIRRSGGATLDEDAAEAIVSTIERYKANEKELRRIISECAAALPNGAFVSPDASPEFMAHLPSEITACSERLVAERDALLTGATAVLPHTVEHAVNLYTVAVACLKPHGIDPEADAIAVKAHRDRLKEALKDLMRGYVSLLESGRDRMRDFGVECDPVDVMETNDPVLIRARQALSEDGQ